MKCKNIENSELLTCRNQSETKFPLTPTLSPGERANRLARLG
jgi:hypothetical protein